MTCGGDCKNNFFHGGGGGSQHLLTQRRRLKYFRNYSVAAVAAEIF
jgi:hypothetical protein